MTGGNARSDYPTTTQYTREQIKLMRAISKQTRLEFISEEAVDCQFCFAPRQGHVPDIIITDSAGYRYAIFVDGSIHEKIRVKRRDDEADDHFVKMGWRRPFRFTNHQINKYPDDVIREIEDALRSRDEVRE